MNEKIVKSVTVTSEFDQWGDDWPPEAAASAVLWFQNKIAAVPQRYRHTAQIEIKSEESYGSLRAVIEVRYTRPQTAKEREADAATTSAEDRLKRDAELVLLKRLQEKYGDVAQRNVVPKQKRSKK